jgi:2-polyprenyl-6-methoxyphenol hydroxylase-like FAD-dependent oxidoreductase
VKILVSGGGIAGLAAALFLRRRGHTVRVIDRAPSFQKRGYAIGLKNFGLKLMQELGLESELRKHALSYDRLCVSRSDGKPLQVLSDEVVGRVTHGHVFMYRSELHAVLHEAASSELGDVGFGLHLQALAQEGARARVTLSDATVDDFDLVVVAEGMRSTTRTLLWGDAGMRPLGVVYAAATVDVAHGLDPRAIHGYFGEAHNVAFIPVDDRRLLVQCYWRQQRTERPDANAARAMMVDAFGAFAPSVRRLLDTIPANGDVFCDAVSMVVIPSRVRGRAVLLGDAGYCPTFLSGMGASLGLLGAKLLAASLPVDGSSVEDSLTRYDDGLRPVVEHFQASALANAETALPSSHWKTVALGWAMHLLPVSVLAKHLGKRFEVEEGLVAGIA